MEELHLSIVRTRRLPHQPLDHLAAAEYAGVPVRDLLKYWKLGLIQPLDSTERYGIYFDEEVIYLVRQAELIRKRFDTNLRTAATMLRMRHEIERLRRELRFHKE